MEHKIISINERDDKVEEIWANESYYCFWKISEMFIVFKFSSQGIKSVCIRIFFFKKRMLLVDIFKISYLNNTWIGILF